MRLFAFLGISLNPLTLAKDIADAFFSALLSLFGTGASSLVTALLGFVKTTSDPVFSGGWWSSSGQAVFERVLAVSASVMALAFMLAIITALLSADHSLLARAALRLPVAVLEMALLVTVTAALVSASDEVSASIARGATGTLSAFVAVAMSGAIGATGIVGLATGALIVIAALCVWAELLCRSALIYVAVMAGPLIFAASVHPSVRGLRRRYVEGGLALILSKVVIALAFATGSAMLSGLGDSASFSAAVGALMEALTILVVAAFAPFILLRLLIGAETILVAEGLERRPARAAVHGARTRRHRGRLRRHGPGPRPLRRHAARRGAPGWWSPGWRSGRATRAGGDGRRIGRRAPSAPTGRGTVSRPGWPRKRRPGIASREPTAGDVDTRGSLPRVGRTVPGDGTAIPSGPKPSPPRKSPARGPR